ncbi:quinone-dependent dihydroorotate dehydrogenase [Oxalicibacterium faecigallinarum]|uniref:Dihydroorotate dehydrogenase (quinone) n=1 Tax=Oxalicibacterium faecigallinarum TaxID=573741 RepID=A0A8J3EZX6_9BURK|nr:quinone-dependent dihydroorotate dehydrogenase [Oxalicibacterium faecigallinarum]GGI15742.1 dihydroorotate dehydrogenase (quinone) [Oxalicibacterium faecigallinarum]
MSEKLLYSLARPFLFAIDPEAAHNLTLPALRCAAGWGLTSSIAKPTDNPRTVMGMTFPNPVGLAAGLDKDGAYIDGLATLGFGFIEVGTVTPRAQPGNPMPRMFRLPQAKAIINRMGFNNGGVDTFVKNVQASRFYQNREGILGLNIGKNADTPIERAVDDYLICLNKVYPYASYVTINISSPNTKNLRQLQGASELDALLSQLKDAQQRLADEHKRYVPIALKIAPDMDQEQIQNVAQALLRHKIDGVIATNTTINREAVKNLKYAEETGGLSGAPVFEASNIVIRELKKELGNSVPIIGVGGILSGADAQAKMNAGASLVQLYTGLIYQGPALVRECAAALHGK